MAPTRRPSGRRTPSLPCRLFSETLDLSPVASKGLRPKWSLRNSPSCPISSLTGSGVASYLQLLVILLPRCCSNMQRCLLCTTVMRFTIYGCINLLLWDVLLAALHLICNTPPKEDNLTGQMWFLNVVYYCEMNGKVHSRSMNWVSMEAYNWDSLHSANC